MMTFIDPARLANQNQASHPQTSHPDYGDYQEPPPPKRKRIRSLIRRILGKDEKNQ